MLLQSHFISNIKGELVFSVGRNAVENSDLIRKSLPGTLWFHLENVPSAHVLIHPPKNLKKKQLRSLCKRGAEICRRYTNSCSDEKFPVCYTEVDNITLLDKPGEVSVRSYKIV